MSGYEAALRRNIEVMNSLEGFDIVMVCCSSDKQAHYWQHRLEKGRGAVLPRSAMVLAVEEDWPGGAGNGESCCAMGLTVVRMEYVTVDGGVCAVCAVC